MKSVERKKQIRSEFFSITETKTDEFSDKLEISEKELIKWINCENELDLSIERDIAHLFGTSVKVLNGENRPTTNHVFPGSEDIGKTYVIDSYSCTAEIIIDDDPSRLYPIDRKNRKKLREFFYNISGQSHWTYFETLNNKLILLNRNNISGLKFDDMVCWNPYPDYKQISKEFYDLMYACYGLHYSITDLLKSCGININKTCQTMEDNKEMDWIPLVVDTKTFNLNGKLVYDAWISLDPHKFHQGIIDQDHDIPEYLELYDGDPRCESSFYTVMDANDVAYVESSLNRTKHLIHLLDCEDNCSLCTLDYTKGYQIG